MKYFLQLLLGAFLPTAVLAQPNFQWAHTYGGNHYDSPNQILQTSDGGYVMVGRTESDDQDVLFNYGNRDVWVVKLNVNGSIEWEKSYGGTAFDSGLGIAQANDGGYFIGGYSNSNDFNVSGRHGTSYDAWVLKISNTGALEWQKMYGGQGEDRVTGIAKSPDGGCVVTGHTYSFDGDITLNHGATDCFVVKFTATGDIAWKKELGGSFFDHGYAITAVREGGYLVVGDVASSDANVPGFKGGPDFFIVKINENGDIEWQKAMGGTDYDIANAVVQTSDGGFAIAGSSSSPDGDVTNWHTSSLYYDDFWVVRITNTGNLLWAKTYGGFKSDVALAIAQDADGGFIAAGYTYSSDGDVTGLQGNEDCWLVKTNADGDLLWQKTLGGGADEEIRTLSPAPDGGFIAGCNTFSTTGDVVGNHGDVDVWLLKYAATVGATDLQPNIPTLAITPNPAVESIAIEIPEGESLATIEMADFTGKTTRLTLQNQKINIESLPTGAYWIKAVMRSGKIFTGKFIKTTR